MGTQGDRNEEFCEVADGGAIEGMSGNRVKLRVSAQLQMMLNRGCTVQGNADNVVHEERLDVCGA